LKKCAYCRSKAGENKIIYKTLEHTIEAIDHFESEGALRLTFYQCPYGNGYHLTKTNGGAETRDGKDKLLQNNGIPLESSSQSSVLWEYEKQDDGEIAEKTIIKPKAKRIQKENPIKKILPGAHSTTTMVKGKIIEIIDKIDIEKYFGVNINNQIAADLLKDLLRETISQITVYTKTENMHIQNSYTIFIENRILTQNKIAKGKIVMLKLKYKMVNNIKIWRSDELLAVKTPDPTYRPGIARHIQPGSPPAP
jgi:hypothetical protein